MEQVLAAARVAGARSAFYTVIRLPWELDALFREWLALHYPDRAARVMARVADATTSATPSAAQAKPTTATTSPA